MMGEMMCQFCCCKPYTNQIILMLFVLILPGTISGSGQLIDVNDIRYGEVNRGSAMRISCSHVGINSHIYIVEALFRQRNDYNQCLNPNSTRIAREWCENDKQQCSIPANESIFTVAHWNTWFTNYRLYLDIRYICIRGENKLRSGKAFRGSTLTISCSDLGINSRINVIYASAWAFDLSCTTAQSVWGSDHCYIYSEINIEKLCINGSKDCSIPVTLNVLEERFPPRFDLEVSYNCIPDDNTTRLALAKEGQRMTISCSNVGKKTKINIIDAKIKQLQHGSVAKYYYWYRFCYIPSEIKTDIVRNWCANHTQNCSIPITDSIFEVRFPTFLLEVQYSCIPVEVGLCPYDYDSDRVIVWPRTIVGKTNYQVCPEKDSSGLCSRTCSINNKGSPMWLDPNCDYCVDKKFSDILNKIAEVEKKAGLDNKQMAEIAESLSNATTETNGLTPGNLNASLNAIVRLTTLRVIRNKNSGRNEIMSIVQAISNLLHTDSSNAWKTLRMANRTVAAALMWSAEIYGNSLVLAMKQKNNYTMVREVAENMVLEGTILEIGNISSEIIFPSKMTDGWYGQRKDWISLSTAALDLNLNSSRPTSLKTWVSYYRNLEAYLPGTDEAILDSRILSLSIDGIKKGQRLNQPITITLHHNMEDKRPEGKYIRLCVFWDFDFSGGGNWSNEGCKVKVSDSEHTVCICDHLTNFAILMSLIPSDDIILDYMSTIGCIISLIALVLTVIIYAVTWKQARTGQVQATVLMNLCVALIIANVIFLVGADKVDSKIWCTVVASLLHYFFLAAFFIMLIEGIELVLHVIYVFHDRSKKETTMLIVSAWILPLIIVAISLGVTRTTGYGNEKICWLAVENGLIWAFIGPVICIIGVNLVIVVVVLLKLFTGRMASNKKQKGTTKIRGMLWNASVICPIAGIAWVFGILCISFNNVVFQYIFVIANSLQGLFIFIFHALFHNQEIRKKLSQLITCGQSAGMRRNKEGAGKKTPGAIDDIALANSGPGQKSSWDTKQMKETRTNYSTTFSSSDQSNTDFETITSTTAEVYKR